MHLFVGLEIFIKHIYKDLDYKLMKFDKWKLLLNMLVSIQHTGCSKIRGKYLTSMLFW